MCLVLTNMERLFGDVKSCFFLLYVGKVWGPSLGSVDIKRGWKISGELRSFQTGHRQSFHGLTCALRRLLLSYTMEPVLQPHGHRGLWGGSPQPKGLSFHPGQTAGVKVLAPQRLLQVSQCTQHWQLWCFMGSGGIPLRVSKSCQFGIRKRPSVSLRPSRRMEFSSGKECDGWDRGRGRAPST